MSLGYKKGLTESIFFLKRMLLPRKLRQEHSGRSGIPGQPEEDSDILCLNNSEMLEALLNEAKWKRLVENHEKNHVSFQIKNKKQTKTPTTL